MSVSIRYINGPGDRLAATQAQAITALLRWLAHRRDHQTSLNSHEEIHRRPAA
ncbi:MAG: hypothetical protein ACRDRS_17850 [Pseudonocardiaceae bacterium]